MIRPPTALTIAGSDSGGGAGIQADLKTFQALGVYGASAITALTAQNTLGVQGVVVVPPAFVAQQIDSVLDDIGADAVKIGMLADSGIVAAVVERLVAHRVTTLVVDPVMVAKGGDALLAPEASAALIADLLPLATVVTPNLHEAGVLLGRLVRTFDDMIAAATAIHAMGPGAVLVKGGHTIDAAGDPSEDSIDVLYDGRDHHTFRAARIDTPNTHGTGCTYAAAIAAELAKGQPLRAAVASAKAYITEAIRCGAGMRIGGGHGPVDHAWAWHSDEEGTMTAARLRPFGASVFSTMTALATEHRAINLAQGFPDFDGPDELLDAAAAAMGAGHNQYARSAGHPRLVQAVAGRVAHDYGLQYDPMTEVAVTAGATEGIAAAMLGLLEPGDEVVLFEPFYDSYPAAVAMAGGVVRPCTLRFPDFALDEAALAACFTARTKAVLLNTPHNPTGKVFTPGELAAIARLAEAHDAFVVSDEVYEHLTYDGVAHVPIATLPGMRDRTLTLSSLGKTYSLTGWKTGWATGPAHLVAGLQAAHQFLTFCSATPFQQAAAVALDSLRDEFVAGLKAEYTERRDMLVGALRDVGFDVAVPNGTYFVLADYTRAWSGGDDHAFARHLTTTVGVACIPPSVFYADNVDEGRRLARFAFCKRVATLEGAAGRLKAGLGG